MNKNILTPTFILLAFLLLAQSSSTPCPIDNYNGTVYSETITLGQSEAISLVEGKDSQCYNFSLPYSFLRVPEVAVGVDNFESERSDNLFYFIKPMRSESLSFIPFVIRTQWRYTRWIRMSFTFLAEDRFDIQSGYYQIDSGQLSGCANGKQISVLLPFKTAFAYGNPFHHNLFLHGFEITTTQVSQNAKSPFQIQIIKSTANVTGIAAIFSVTTLTEVNHLYVSYIAYQKTSLNVGAGDYTYDEKDGRGFSHTPDISIPRNYARIYGFTGFIINHNEQSLFLSTQWTGFQFHFHFQNNDKYVQHLTFSYLFFLGSECSDCPGYPYAYNDTCVTVCPPKTFLTRDGLCLSCGEGRTWNGKSCQIDCPSGQYPDKNGKCVCPLTLHWNGDRCIPCYGGKVWDKENMECRCPYPLRWNGFACASIARCQNGTEWNVFTYSCECPDHQYWNRVSRRCLDVPRCFGGQVLNSNYQCVCPENQHFNNGRCEFSPCYGGQYWSPALSRCICPQNTNYDGKICRECINGQVWNDVKLECECEKDYAWNGLFCKKQKECISNLIYDPDVEQCVCPTDEFWNGRQCIKKVICSGGRIFDTQTLTCICQVGYKWDTNKCQRCINGQIWDEPELKCLCPRGTQWKNNQCQVIQQCRNGQQWNANLNICQCPAGTVFNGVFCIFNPCTNGRSWNAVLRLCVCPKNKIWDGGACLPPRIDCTNGQIWDETIYACTCPIGTFPNINKCDPIPICKNGQVYNPLNNKCQCPYSMIFEKERCVQPSCPEDQFWNGNRCVKISCPPGSYYKDNKCVSEPDDCEHSYYWNGQMCRYYKLFCPYGTVWANEACQTVGKCEKGYYQDRAGVCRAIPQQCVPPTYWNEEKCQVVGTSCPSGMYYSGNTCRNIHSCESNQIWNEKYLRCDCPEGQQSNGQSCISCTGGKLWMPGIGCRCPLGKFDFGSFCESIDELRCLNIPNSMWQNNLCHCKEGYTKIGLQCVCYGVESATGCDRCSQKPNSIWNQYYCRCMNGYTEIDGNCVLTGSIVGNDEKSSCNVGSYFQPNHRKCLACPTGCLSCTNSYSCAQCRPQFHYYKGLCLERCGDGMKFVLDCDDGNNDDGDGCSRDCRVENGYVCRGGSPQNKDNCIVFEEKIVKMVQTGQTRMITSIILGVKLDYMPQKLFDSAECANQCRNILIGQIIDGDKSAISITSNYVPGTTFSFSVHVEFGRSTFGQFTIRITIDKKISQKYFSSVSTETDLTILVNPAYLAMAEEEEVLSR